MSTTSFRGYFALNSLELINTSRTVAHLGIEPPTTDVGLLRPIQRAFLEDPPGSGLYIPAMDEDPPGSGFYELLAHDFHTDESPVGSGLYQVGECSLMEISSLLYEIPETSERLVDMPGFYTPPDGSSLYGPGMVLVEDGCWGFPRTCPGCQIHIIYDDTWPQLRNYLHDPVYRTQMAPWHSTQLAESDEFIGIWLMDVKGLGATPISRPIAELVGSGGTAGPHRDTTRTITFDALLMGCTHAGLEFGLDWLSCRLRETAGNAHSSLRFLNANPTWSDADPLELLRDVHGVVLTKSPEVTDQFVSGSRRNQHATMYRVQWEMTATVPYLYLPPVEFDVEWDEVINQSISWVHDAECNMPQTCVEMPVLFSATCQPEVIDLPAEPPPVCGGCIPVCALETYVWYMPTLTYPVRCRETAVSMVVKNMHTTKPLTAQLYWRSCNADPDCQKFEYPLQVSGLPPNFDLHMDAVHSRFWGELRPRATTLGVYERGAPAAPIPGIGRPRPFRPVGIVGTPNGAPWRPPIIDRQDCWQLVAVAPVDALFEVSVSLADRDP